MGEFPGRPTDTSGQGHRDLPILRAATTSAGIIGAAIASGQLKTEGWWKDSNP